MRRIDRILSNVLREIPTQRQNEEVNADISVTHEESSTSCESPDILKVCGDDLNVGDLYKTKDNTGKKSENDMNTSMFNDDKENTCRQMAILGEENLDIDSPLAPIYSPLTPLVATNIKETSPLRPMTPETYEVYKTLCHDCDLDAELNLISTDDNQLENQISDFGSDTDSDFIPNSHSDSSEEDKSRSKKVKVVALVHNKNLPEDKNENISTDTQTNRTDSNIHNIEQVNETIYNQDKPNPIPITQGIDERENIIQNYDVQSTGRPKKGRKRKYPQYTLAEKKYRKYNNLPYHTAKKIIESKSFKNYTCKCKNKCHEKVLEETRLAQFEKYINLDTYEAQLLFIVNCVQEIPKKRSYTTINNATEKKAPKQFSRKYFIDKTIVCREMFTNTFQITPKKIDVCMKKHRTGKSIKDNRGQACAGWNKTKEEDVQFIINIIQSLPKYESHYRRQTNNSREYLKLGMTIQKIYDLYVEKLVQLFGETKKPVSFTVLKQIFYKNFNLKCKSLKKDTCSRCDTFTNKINNSSEQEKEKLIEEKSKHLKLAEDLRNNMNHDLKRAETDPEFECITFDLEKTLPLPRIPTSIVFYKRQLWLYNCGVHSGTNGDGFCYIWVEGEAGRGAQEVGSCLVHFIKNQLSHDVKYLVLWSDCCGGQNRNIKIVLMMKIILNNHPTLQTITFKYLESGHTFLPNDTDFSKIETQLKYYERIYTAEEYINVIKSSKKQKPLKVYRMTKNDFIGTKNIEKKIVNRKVSVNKTKVNWLHTKEIYLKKEETYSIFMKNKKDEEFQELNIKKLVKGSVAVLSENDFVNLWPNGKEIPQAKLEDLESMYDLIPKDCIHFYKSLKGNTNLVEDVDGYGSQLDFDIIAEEGDD